MKRARSTSAETAARFLALRGEPARAADERQRAAELASPRVPRNPSARHQAARPVGIETTGFALALFAHTRVRLGLQGRFIPDAFAFNRAAKSLVLYEVTVTNEVSARKLDKLRLLREVLFDLGWSIRLMIGGSDGNFGEVDIVTGEVPPELLRAAIDAIGRRP